MVRTCLIVEDSRVVRRVTRTIMEGLSFTCQEAENGQEAMVACEKQMPELILLDWNMPIMNGIDFLKKLRTMPQGDVPKVVFCSTENDFKHIQQGMEAGANEYIMKPFDADIIKSKLEILGVIGAS